MDKLPIDLFIQEITYLPFSTVTNICQTNKRFHEYCTDPRYSNRWKVLIENAFSNLDDYQENLKTILDKYGGYNYLVYTNFIKLLDPVAQAMIYYRQGDLKEFEKFTQKQKFMAMFLLNNREGMLKYDKDGFLTSLYTTDINVRKLSNLLYGMIEDKTIIGIRRLIKEGAVVGYDKLSFAVKVGDLKIFKELVKYFGELNNTHKQGLIILAKDYSRNDILNYLQKL